MRDPEFAALLESIQLGSLVLTPILLALILWRIW